MVFSVGIGSAGEGGPSYLLRLPFILLPGRRLKLAESSRFELLGRTCEISEEPNQYVLTATGFESEDAAANFLPKICAGLIWFGLKHSVGLRFSPEATPVNLFDNPKSIAEDSMVSPIASKAGWHEYDGHYDSDKTVIRPDHKRLFVFRAGSVTARLDTPVSILSSAMFEGMSFSRAEQVLCAPKLRLASEVYLSSHFESTPTASFLSRITTLEILATEASAVEPVGTMVDRFIGEAKDARERVEDPAVQSEFDSLISRLANLRNRSIKSQLRRLVEETLRTDAEITDSTAVSREISDLYDLRSILVHSGEADAERIRKANSRLNEVVPRVLKALFKETAECPAPGVL